MIRAFVIAFVLGTAVAAPAPVAPVVPGHGIGYGGYGAYGGFGYPVPVTGSTVVKHSEVASAGGFPAAGITPIYGAYGYPGLGNLGFGFPKAVTQTHVTTTAVRPGIYGYY